MYKDERIKRQEEEEKNKYANELLDILGDEATEADKLYQDIEKLEKKVIDKIAWRKEPAKLKDKIGIQQKPSSNIKNYTSDKRLNEVLTHLYISEGGYNNNRKNDLGGATNYGIRQITYDTYRKAHNLPLQKVKGITINEASKIYQEMYWRVSGADKIKDKNLAMLVMDTAVLHGPQTAKKWYNETGGNFDKIINLRLQHYKKRVQEDPSQKDNYNGWINRLNYPI